MSNHSYRTLKRKNIIGTIPNHSFNTTVVFYSTPYKEEEIRHSQIHSNGEKENRRNLQKIFKLSLWWTHTSKVTPIRKLIRQLQNHLDLEKF